MLSLSPALRRLFFLLTVGTFFSTTLLVLFHTFGYRFSPERGVFIYTGSLTIEANPVTNVEVSIDGVPVSKKRQNILNNSINVSGLAPGEHFVEVSAKGYVPWTKKAVIESGRSTEFWNVQLTRTDPLIRAIPGTENALFLSAGPRENLYAVVKEPFANGTEYTVDILDADNDTSEQIYSTLELIRPTALRSILWSANGRRLLIPIGTNEASPNSASSPSYVLVDIRTGESTVLRNIFPDSSLPLHDFRFDPTEEDSIFFMHGPELYRMNTREASSSLELLHASVAAYDISSRSLYFIERESGIVYRASLERNNFNVSQITLGALPAQIDLANRELSAYRMIVYDENRMAFLETARGMLFVYNSDANEQLKRIGSDGIRSMQFSDDGKKLLYFSLNEISVYFMREWEVQPNRTIDSQFQIARFSQSIEHVQWSKSYEHVLYALGNNLKIIELDSRDHRNILDLANFPKPPVQVLTRFADDLLYFVAPETSGGPSLVRTLGFPEPAGFFNF